MEHYLGVAGEMGVSDEEIGAVHAIVMAVSGLGADGARGALARADGRVGRALADLGLGR